MKQGDLIPLKRVLEEVGVSRSTLWRALRSGIAGFPTPTIIRRRVYWKVAQINAIEAGLDAYQGRCAFDAGQSRTRHERQGPYRDALKQKKSAKRARRRMADTHLIDDAQSDLFESRK